MVVMDSDGNTDAIILIYSGVKYLRHHGSKIAYIKIILSELQFKQKLSHILGFTLCVQSFAIMAKFV